MHYSQIAIDLVKQMEGLRITPYGDVAGYQTIGYGHRIKPNELFTSFDKVKANDLLLADLTHAQDAINRLVTVPLSQCQFDALVSFTFNLGAANLEQSTLLKRLNESDYVGAANEFGRWVYAGNPKQVFPGLVARREKEKELFLKGQ